MTAFRPVINFFLGKNYHNRNRFTGFKKVRYPNGSIFAGRVRKIPKTVSVLAIEKNATANRFPFYRFSKKQRRNGFRPTFRALPKAKNGSRTVWLARKTRKTDPVLTPLNRMTVKRKPFYLSQKVNRQNGFCSGANSARRQRERIHFCEFFMSGALNETILHPQTR